MLAWTADARPSGCGVRRANAEYELERHALVEYPGVRLAAVQMAGDSRGRRRERRDTFAHRG